MLSGNFDNTTVPLCCPCVEDEDRIEYRLYYYYIGHISKFVRPEAKVIATSTFTSNIETVSFKNTDGSIVCVLLNKTNNPIKSIIRIAVNIKEVILYSHSITTAVINK